jgi:uncharacterized DUF497 family protein
MDLVFEWDEKKNKLNQREHKISFEDAAMVFYDPNQKEIYDWKHSCFEERWKVIGLVEWDILAVSFTEEDGIIRIISAREADKDEEKEYLEWQW